MVFGYVPLGGDNRKLLYETQLSHLDNPYLYRVCADGLLRRYVLVEEGIQIVEKCHTTTYGGHYGSFDVWGMGPFAKSEGYEYILFVVDYVSKWVEELPCKAADAKHAKKMFH